MLKERNLFEKICIPYTAQPSQLKKVSTNMEIKKTSVGYRFFFKGLFSPSVLYAIDGSASN